MNSIARRIFISIIPMLLQRINPSIYASNLLHLISLPANQSAAMVPLSTSYYKTPNNHKHPAKCLVGYTNLEMRHSARIRSCCRRVTPTFLQPFIINFRKVRPNRSFLNVSEYLVIDNTFRAIYHDMFSATLKSSRDLLIYDHLIYFVLVLRMRDMLVDGNQSYSLLKNKD